MGYRDASESAPSSGRPRPERLGRTALFRACAGRWPRAVRRGATPSRRPRITRPRDVTAPRVTSATVRSRSCAEGPGREGRSRRRPSAAPAPGASRGGAVPGRMPLRPARHSGRGSPVRAGQTPPPSWKSQTARWPPFLPGPDHGRDLSHQAVTLDVLGGIILQSKNVVRLTTTCPPTRSAEPKEPLADPRSPPCQRDPLSCAPAPSRRAAPDGRRRSPVPHRCRRGGPLGASWRSRGSVSADLRGKARRKP